MLQRRSDWPNDAPRRHYSSPAPRHGTGLTSEGAVFVDTGASLAGGGVGGVIPGFLDLHMKPSAKWALRAGGGLAVFVVPYFWSPAHWVAPQPGPVTQHTSGMNSPAINGNTVINAPTR